MAYFENINKLVQYLVGLIAKTAINNNNWKLFGFKSLPKRGNFFNRFIDKSLLEKENFLLKELTLLSIIDILEAIKRTNINLDYKLLLIIGVLSEVYIPLSQMNHFKNRTDFVLFLRNGIQSYQNETFSDSFISRVKQSVDEKNSVSLIMGSVILDTYRFPRDSVLLDRTIITQQIKIDDISEKLKSSLNVDELKMFTNLAKDILNS